jgi:N-acetylneuraminic acid mutarotase
LIICAGTNDDNQRLNDTWVYDFGLNQWSELLTSGDLKARNGHSAVMLHDKHMIVFGGISEVTKELDDLYCLDIEK